MGKNAAMKKHPTIAPQQPKSAFFPQAKVKLTQAPDEPSEVPAKMALTPEAGKSPGPDAVGRAVLREQLMQIEAKIIDKMTALIAPLTAQIQELKDTISQVAQTADAAMELGMTVQDSTGQLQRQATWAADKIIALENQIKINNIKLRGFPEGVEDSTELRAFISSWLASQLDLEEGIAPVLDAAYRIGPPRKSNSSLPRDILVKCADSRTKQKILALARGKGFLSFDTYKIQALQDLSAETLEARRRLKPITTLLTKFKFRYRWQSYTKIQVVFKGVSLLADDFDTGAQLLQALGIDLPPDYPKPDAPPEGSAWSKA